MTDPIFVSPRQPITLQEIVTLTGAEPVGDFDPLAVIQNIKPLDLAGPGDLAFLESPKFHDAFLETRAGACLIGQRYADERLKGTALLVSKIHILLMSPSPARFMRRHCPRHQPSARAASIPAHPCIRRRGLRKA